MAGAKVRKEYAAERRAAPATSAAGIIDDEDALRRHREILAAIEGLRDHLKLPGANALQVALPEGADPTKLRAELESLHSAIMETKKEIAALRHPGAANPDPLISATDELDAVVEATESATHTILSTVEGLEEMLQRIGQAQLDTFVAKSVDEMKEMIVKIYEACNFQDITGQRINKVVKTMKFVDERVNAMISIWGTESFAGIDSPGKPEPEGDSALLEGPQMPENAVSQDDIDKLFE